MNLKTYTFPLDYPHKGDEGTMHYCSNLFPKETKVQYDLAHDLTGLYFNLSNEIKCQVSETAEHTIGRNQFNMLYLPKGCHCQLTFEKGNYESFFIELPIPLLKMIIENFPFVGNFLEEACQKMPFVMNGQGITPAMREYIANVIFVKYSVVDGEVLLRARFVDIMILCFEHRQQDEYPGFDKDDIEKIREAYALIMEDIKAPHSVNQLADNLNIEQRKLERGFRILFQTTVYNFLVEERMKKAIALLRDTTLSIGEVAASVGYPKAREFTNIFKRKFGFSPKLMRKEGDKFK